MWSVISFTLPNYLQIIFHSLHTITALLAKGKRVRERESLPVVPPQVHAFSHRIIVVVAHHCSTVTHPWIDRTTMSIHLLTTTTMTRSDHLYLDGDLDLAANLVTIASLFLLSLLSLPLSFLDLVATSTSLFLAATTSTLSLSHHQVLGLWNWDFCFAFCFFGFILGLSSGSLTRPNWPDPTDPNPNGWTRNL